jgi:tRNA A-37 threonylcarbamoyl transferase component Bud32
MEGLIGKTIGRYRIVEHLGRGGMAEVYKAYQPSLDRYVAIKLMHTFLADEKEFLARFEREAKVVATLRHPNIVQVYDFDVENGVYYMVMEFIEGETLKARMQALETKGEWVSLDDAVRIILATGSALKYAHDRGMVHRDVKPANVMITTDGQVILTDFGIAKIVSASNLTASGAMVGTPSYMAPEQGMGQPGDERSDIYSLGVMLYQLLLGRLPYDADTPLAVVLKHINEPLPMPKLIKPDLPTDLERVILKSLAKDPNDRYQKVGEMLTDLRKAVGLPIEDTQPGTAKSSAIKLSGATIVGRVGSLTPPPRVTGTAAVAKAATGVAATQVASPQTMVSPGTAGTVVVTPLPAAVPAPVGAKRPLWIIPVAIVAILAIVVVAVIAASGNRAADVPPANTATIAPINTPTNAPINTPTLAPITTQLMSFKNDNVELRDKAGSDSSSQVQGLLPQVTQFHVLARSTDSQWLKIQTPDGTGGWVDADAVGLDADQLSQVPVATTLTKPTDTPMPTLPPTDVPTATPTTKPTNTPGPTKTPGPTRPPATPKPAATAKPAATPTSSAAIPLTLDWGVVSYDPLEPGNPNWTATIRLYASGGDGKYHYYIQDPDTGLWDEKVGPDAFYVIRSRRCKAWLHEMRVIDESGHSFSRSYSIDPPPGCTS